MILIRTFWNNRSLSRNVFAWIVMVSILAEVGEDKGGAGLLRGILGNVNKRKGLSFDGAVSEWSYSI